MYRPLTESEIVNSALAGYIRRIWKGLIFLVIAILVSELFMFFTMSGHESELISSWMPERWLYDFAYFKRHVIIPSLINSIGYLIFYSIYKIGNGFYKAQISLTMYLILIASVYVFGHYGMFYLSVAFMFPILLTSPFTAWINTATGITVLGLTVVNYAYQQRVKCDYYNVFVLITNCCLLGMSWIISKALRRVYAQMMHRNFEIARQANVDALTGLLNRNAFNSRLQDTEHIKSLAFVDVDHFKYINDAYKHAKGDMVLKIVAKSLSQIEGYSDGIYRFGGDEFIVFANCPGDYLANLLKQVKDDFSRTVLRNLGIEVTLSIGVRDYDGTDLTELVENADSLMYKAKQKGRNSVVYEKL